MEKIKFQKVSIELFPAEKSCEQGCPPCPLARKGNEVTATSINPQVQETFTLLEQAFKDHDISYDMHFTVAFGKLMPVLKYPELIDMARFSTDNLVRFEGGTKKFAQSIQDFLIQQRINPKVIGYSIVPTAPAISETEVNLIRQINKELSDWYFKSPHREIEVTIRSNLIKPALYDQVLPQVFAADVTLIRGLVEEFSKNPKHIARVADEPDGRMYASFYEGVHRKRTISIGNRVITSKSLPNTPQFNVHQAMSLFPDRINGVQDFAIAPKGVMLVHSSTAINSPVLWITHKDFRDSLQGELKKGAKFSSLKFLVKMMKENCVMYQFFIKEAERLRDTSPIDFMKSYENSRLGVREAMLTHTKKKK